jgi:TatD DNase family protein
MIDVHCHLEQSDFNRDRANVIQECRRELDAVITSCAVPDDLDLTLSLTRRHGGFLFASAGLHPSDAGRASMEDVLDYFQRIKDNANQLVAIGETGLDYNWAKDLGERDKQNNVFIHSIALAEELGLPLVIHSRDAITDCLEVLEEQNAERVHWHMFTHHASLKRVLDNGWHISVNTLLLSSREVRKIVEDCPLDHLMLETDSPWLGVNEAGKIKPKNKVRNQHTTVKKVAEMVAKIKGVTIKEVDRQTTENAKVLFQLDLLPY